MRQFFQEGELVLAEVQGVGQTDGTAMLHTRSLRYGKLRNGVFLAVAGNGAGGPGVVRGKRQTFSMNTGGGGGEVEVVLGVNGFIWIAKVVDPPVDANGGESQEKMGRAGGISITSLEESVSASIYSSQNDVIPTATRREIARLVGAIRALADGGVRIDEDTVTRAYVAALEIEVDAMADEGEEAGIYYGGERGKRIVEIVLDDA